MEKLYTRRSSGKLAVWTISVNDNGDGTATIVTIHGMDGGKMQVDRKNVTKGVNIGKSNEKTPYQNAVRQATSKWNKKYDKGARQRPDDIVKPIRPMEAHPYSKRGKDIVWPCMIQPKLDGIRALVHRTEKEGKVVFYSRGGNEYTSMKHLVPIVKKLISPGEWLDGELYIHGEAFENLTSWVRKYKEGLSERIELHLFDMPSDRSFVTMRNELSKRLSRLSEHDAGMVVGVETLLMPSFDAMKEMHGVYVEAGYEGTMLRNMNQPYQWSKRTIHLQKYKDFCDDEFTITGITQGQGDEEGAIMFECAAGEGFFTVRPKGSIKSRKAAFVHATAEPSLFIGQPYTVRYQNLSPYGIPRFPSGVALRNYE